MLTILCYIYIYSCFCVNRYKNMRWTVMCNKIFFALLSILCSRVISLFYHVTYDKTSIKMYFTLLNNVRICDMFIYHVPVICFDAHWKIIKLVQISSILHDPPVEIWNWFGLSVRELQITVHLYFTLWHIWSEILFIFHVW